MEYDHSDDRQMTEQQQSFLSKNNCTIGRLIFIINSFNCVKIKRNIWRSSIKTVRLCILLQVFVFSLYKNIFKQLAGSKLSTGMTLCTIK
jgi:hypothetical protein